MASSKFVVTIRVDFDSDTDFIFIHSNSQPRRGAIRLNKRKLVTVLSSTAILLSIHSIAPSASANSQTLNDLEQQRKELQQEQSNLNSNIGVVEVEMDSLNAERKQLNQDIAEIQENIAIIIAQIGEQELEIARLEEEINKLNNEIEILQENISRRNAALAEQARGVQTAGSPDNIIDIILTAESLTEIIGKMEVISTVVRNNNNIMEEQIRDRKAVEAAREEVDQAREESNRVKEEMEANRNQLVSQKAALDEKVRIVSEKFELSSSERDALLSQQREVAAQTEKINQQVEAEKARIAAEKAAKEKAEREARERAAREEAARKAAAVQVSSSNQSSSSSSSSSSNNSGWVRPSYGYVTSEYGYRIDPISGYTRLHGGIDIGGGGPIVAAKSGTVTIAGWHYQYGNYVKISHGGGVDTLYAHLQSDMRVSPGQSVSAGQRIGTMGTTGYSTGVHLHFEVFVNGAKVNPRNYVSF